MASASSRNRCASASSRGCVGAPVEHGGQHRPDLPSSSAKKITKAMATSFGNR